MKKNINLLKKNPINYLTKKHETYYQRFFSYQSCYKLNSLYYYNIYSNKNPELTIKSTMGFFKIIVNYLIISERCSKIEILQEKPKTFFNILSFKFTDIFFKNNKKYNCKNKKINPKILLKFKIFSIFLKKTIILIKTGSKTKLILKGFGRRVGKKPKYIYFRLGHSFILKKTVPKMISFFLSKKKTRIRLFTNNLKINNTLINEIIKLKPTFTYKDVGIRLFGVEPKLKQRKKANF